MSIVGVQTSVSRSEDQFFYYRCFSSNCTIHVQYYESMNIVVFLDFERDFAFLH